jgi:hypothetical protein
MGEVAVTDEDLTSLLKGEPQQTNMPVSAQLVRLATSKYRFVTSTEGMPYALPKDGPPIAVPLRGENSFKRQLAIGFYQMTQRPAASGALSDALLILEGEADKGGAIPIHQRVAPTAEGIRLDLADPEKTFVDISPSGWVVKRGETDGPVFRRTKSTGALPIPQAGDLRGLWQLVNVAEPHRGEVLGWLVATLFPEVAQPILLLRGEQGTGKTTAAKMLVDLVDPGQGRLASPPRSERDWAVAASGRSVIGLDNLSVIPPWLSDVFCRAVTGDSSMTRALFTDSDLSILTFRVAMVITSIDAGSLRGDLADRLLPIELERFDDGPKKRRSEVELFNQFHASLPRLLGALLTLTSAALKSLPTVAEPDGGLPRMADFARVLAACDIVSGEESFGAYQASTKDLESDVLEGDPLAAALIKLVEYEGHWEGTATQLLSNLALEMDFTPEIRRTWPNSAGALSGRLTRMAPALREYGIEYENKKCNGQRRVTLWLRDS